MKKLLKEVWKSFSKSKIILSGLIILIFLTSGIITLIFDVVHSYTSQYNSYKQVSKLHDITMDANLKLNGSRPDKLYEKKYKNSSNLIENQWEYIEINPELDSINLSTSSQYYSLKEFLPYFDDVYVKTKELSNILNTNLNMGTPFVYNSKTDKYDVTLESTGNNTLKFYKKNLDGSYSEFDNSGPITSITGGIYDTYNANTKTWSASLNIANLIKIGTSWTLDTKPLVYDHLTNRLFLKDALTASNSDEANRYAQSANTLWTELDKYKAGRLYGFYQYWAGNRWCTWFKTYYDSKNPNWTWIFDGTEATLSTYHNKYVSDVYTKLPRLKSNFNLVETIPQKEEAKLNLTTISLPSSWFVYSKYNYIYTKETTYLAGVDQEGNIDKNQWTGYYYNFLNNLKLTDPRKYKELISFSYWTKDILVTRVDKNGNPIYQKDNQGNFVLINGEKVSFQSKFNVMLTTKDLSENITNAQGVVSTISQIEDMPATEETLTFLTNDQSASNETYIQTFSKNYQYNQIYKEIQDLVKEIGIRETVTVNSNDKNSTNVYQFINLGNSNYEIQWNDILVKQEVGKLLNTSTQDEIFTLPSNVQPKSNKIPLIYIPKIVDTLLSGITLDRNYINPMISYDRLTYYNDNGELITTSGNKVVWLSPNGDKNTSNLYGVSAVYNSNGDKTYFILKRDLTNVENNNWNIVSEYSQGIKSYDVFAQFIMANNLNLAPFDLFGKDLQIISQVNGWAKKDDKYSDKYYVPFQYLLPNSEIISDYNDAIRNPQENIYGLEKVRDKLIYFLTFTVKPLVSHNYWEVLMEAVNRAMAKYGFIAGLTPPAELSNATIVKLVIGIFKEAAEISNEDLIGPILVGLVKGIKNKINEGNNTIESQHLILNTELDKIFKIIELTTGDQNVKASFLNSINLMLGTNFQNISDLIVDPISFLDGLIKFICSIQWDDVISEFWTLYEPRPINVTVGAGDIFPLIYKHIYSTKLFLKSLEQMVASTSIGPMNSLELFKKLSPNRQFSWYEEVYLGGKTVNDLVSQLSMKNPLEGYNNLMSKVVNIHNDKYNIDFNSLSFSDILSNFDLVVTIFNIHINLGDMVKDQPSMITPIEFLYNPGVQNQLSLDLDLLWFLTNYVFVDENNKKMNLFNIDVDYLLTNAINSFTEIKHDYNQVILEENAGKIAIVNEAFLNQNNKEIYTSSTLLNDLHNLEKIDSKYKINVSGVEYVIIGTDFSVDYIYPVINYENITVNTKSQALVYVNQMGFDRIRRSNENNLVDKYFLLTNIQKQSLNELQTKLNQLAYYWATGQAISVDIANDNEKNIYKVAFLSTETSYLNPERSLRITIINDLIKKLELAQKLAGIILILIVSIVIIFVIKRYISSRSKVLGILKAQGYSSIKIALSICLFPLFVSVIGATFGYIAGLVSQFGAFDLFKIFWTLPIHTIPFNWITFLITLIIPIVFLSALTIVTTLWFLNKHKPMAMLNGSMEANNSKIALKVNSLLNKSAIKSKFSFSLALGSIGKLFALFISSLFTATTVLFFITSFNSFNKSINSTYQNKEYKYWMIYNTPTIEGGEIKTFEIKPGGNNDISNMLYVPVGTPEESYLYISSYFKPGYNSIINKQILVNGVLTDSNGILDLNDTTTPHIFTKSSLDLTVLSGGISINVWNTLYNSLPESQKVSILDKSNKASKWMEWTQEGKEFVYQGKTYITKFVLNEKGEIDYLSLWDPNLNNYVQITTSFGEKQNIRVNYFAFIYNHQSPSLSKFVYRNVRENNAYYDENLLITGQNNSNLIRQLYREFLVNGYNLMINYDLQSDNPSNSLLNPNERLIMPTYALDYFISPGFMMLSHDNELNVNDETFTYLDTQNIFDSQIKPQIMGYNSDSKYVHIIDKSKNNLITKAEQFSQEKRNQNIYPLIINHVVSLKYGLKINDVLTLQVNNKFNRNQERLKEKLGLATESKVYKFEIIGINESYINEEWITSHEIANQILNLSSNSYNGIISNATAPAPIVNILPLYSENGYWSADNKIYSSEIDINQLNNYEKQSIVNIYRQLFYNLDSNGNNISLMSNHLKLLFPELTDVEINSKIKLLLNWNNDMNLDIKFDSNKPDDVQNIVNVKNANQAIEIFKEIYSENAMSSFFYNASSNGVEKEYVSNASKTINDGMTIVIVISFAISLTVLIMITSMIINENERNIAIFGILGYKNFEKISMFFSIYIPIVIIAIATSVLLTNIFLPFFLTTILNYTSIALPISLSFIQTLITSGLISFVFAITCMISWYAQGRIKPIILLKEV